MEGGALPKLLHRHALSIGGAFPVFPAGNVAKSSTPPSRARHLPHFRLRLALLFFSFLGSP